MSGACQLEGCTVLQTGACALEHDVATCPNRIDSDEGPAVLLASMEVEQAEELGGAVLDTPEESPSFPPSTALGLNTVDQMLASRYGTIIGILGDPEAGKTACLASLYLLVSHARLSGWSFADSWSLMAFEEIARGARRWKDGEPPEQMTVHTELSDDRQPGLLHLRLRRDFDGNGAVDLFLPDLPGEWTRDLIRTADFERFEFMKSADVIWLMTDGRALIKKEGRQGAIHRINLLIGRLAKMFEGCAPRLILVPTHRDHGEVPEIVISQIYREAATLGFSLDVIPVASFSEDDGAIVPGYGLSELIGATVRIKNESTVFRQSSPVRFGMRSFLSYRRFE